MYYMYKCTKIFICQSLLNKVTFCIKMDNLYTCTNIMVYFTGNWNGSWLFTDTFYRVLGGFCIGGKHNKYLKGW